VLGFGFRGGWSFAFHRSGNCQASIFHAKDAKSTEELLVLSDEVVLPFEGSSETESSGGKFALISSADRISLTANVPTGTHQVKVRGELFRLMLMAYIDLSTTGLFADLTGP
jgi:hypothetical protein